MSIPIDRQKVMREARVAGITGLLTILIGIAMADVLGNYRETFVDPGFPVEATALAAIAMVQSGGIPASGSPAGR